MLKKTRNRLWLLLNNGENDKKYKYKCGLLSFRVRVQYWGCKHKYKYQIATSLFCCTACCTTNTQLKSNYKWSSALYCRTVKFAMHRRCARPTNQVGDNVAGIGTVSFDLRLLDIVVDQTTVNVYGNWWRVVTGNDDLQCAIFHHHRVYVPCNEITA